MGIYLYRAKKGPQEIVDGEIEALNQQEALSKIDSLGFFLISIKEKQSSSKISEKVSLKEVTAFTSHLSTLLNSGSTLITSLNTLVTETEQARINPIILDIILQLKDGKDFSESLKRYPCTFSQLYTSLVKVGETSGTLGENLKRIAEFLEEDMDFRNNITSILTYPLIIVGVGLLTVFILLKFVIPKLVGILNDLGQTLPWATTLLINFSNFFSKYGFFILILIPLFFLIGKNYIKNPKYRLQWDRLKLRLPLLGELLTKIEICRLSRTLSILLKNGLPMDISLKVITSTVSNLFLRQAIVKVEEDIKQGVSLNAAMKKTKVFSSSFINVVTVGEDSGTLSMVLDNLSNDYNKEINRGIKNLLTLLEPLLILGVGLMVGFIVLSMLFPIFQIDFNF